MKTMIWAINLALFGAVFPLYLSRRSRGVLLLAAMAAPWLAFWMGWLAR